MSIDQVSDRVYKASNILGKVIAYIKWDAKCAQYILYPQFETNYTANDLEIITNKLRQLNGM